VPLYPRKGSGFLHFPIFYAKLGQFFPNEFRRIVFLIAQFRMLMQPSAAFPGKSAVTMKHIAPPVLK
jgi:hypothetical protein